MVVLQYLNYTEIIGKLMYSLSLKSQSLFYMRKKKMTGHYSLFKSKQSFWLVTTLSFLSQILQQTSFKSNLRIKWIISKIARDLEILFAHRLYVCIECDRFEQAVAIFCEIFDVFESKKFLLCFLNKGT